MRFERAITVLRLLVSLLAGVAASVGIFSSGGPGPHTFASLRGDEVLIGGRGIYRHMSAEWAPQGIAQDVVTVVVSIPLLVAGPFWAKRESLRGRLPVTALVGKVIGQELHGVEVGAPVWC